MKACLEFALNLLRDPAHWTQGEIARDAEGNRTPYDSPKAVSWCLSGAIAKSPDSTIETHNQIRESLPRKSFVAFNDTRTHSEVINWLENKIAELS